MKMLWEESFLFLAVEGKGIRAEHWTFHSKSGRMYYRVLNLPDAMLPTFFPSYFQYSLMLLRGSDSLTWKEAGRWDEDKTGKQFNSLCENLALLRLWWLLTATSTSSTVLVRRGHCIPLFRPTGDSSPTFPKLLDRSYCAHLGLCRDPTCSRRSLVLQPNGSDCYFLANLTVRDDEGFVSCISLGTIWCRDQHTFPAAIPTINNIHQKRAVHARGLWDLKCLQLSSSEGEEQRCNS